VAKSLVFPARTGVVTRYRLLEATRVYALEKLEESGKAETVARRHAEYFASLLARAAADHDSPDCLVDASPLSGHLGSVRASLEWAFGTWIATAGQSPSARAPSGRARRYGSRAPTA